MQSDNISVCSNTRLSTITFSHFPRLNIISIDSVITRFHPKAPTMQMDPTHHLLGSWIILRQVKTCCQLASGHRVDIMNYIKFAKARLSTIHIFIISLYHANSDPISFSSNVELMLLVVLFMYLILWHGQFPSAIDTQGPLLSKPVADFLSVCHKNLTVL